MDEELYRRLAALADPEKFQEWLNTPNAAFVWDKPIDMLEEGRVGLLWELVYRIESGDPI